MHRQTGSGERETDRLTARHRDRQRVPGEEESQARDRGSCHTFTYAFSYLFGYEKTEDCKVYTHTRRAPRSQVRHGKGNRSRREIGEGRGRGTQCMREQIAQLKIKLIKI